MIPITEENKCTITYSEDSKGFPSFYTYCPEFIKGMNQYLYTFKNLEHILDPEPLFRGPKQQNTSKTIKDGLDQV